MKRKGLFILLILSLTLIFTVGCSEKDSAENETVDIDSDLEDNDENEKKEPKKITDPLQIGDKAHNFTLEDLEGNTVSLEDYRGKIVLLNFWTTTWPYCRKEMGDFQKIYDEYKDDDFVILAVDVMESKSTVKEYIDEEGYTFPVLLDTDGRVAYDYFLSGVPLSFFIDGDGVVSGIKLGALTYPELKQRIESIRSQE